MSIHDQMHERMAAAAEFLEEMLNVGTVSPRYAFGTERGTEPVFVLFHPLYGEFVSSDYDGEIAAGLAVLAEVCSYADHLAEEGSEMVTAYAASAEKMRRRSIIDKMLNKHDAEMPDRTELIEIVTRAKRVSEVIAHLSSLFVLLKDGIISASVFDAAVKILDVETLIASPVDSIVPDDEPAEAGVGTGTES